MLRVYLKLLFLIVFISNANAQVSTKEYLFVGHAYGSHSKLDNNLDPIFLSHLQKNNYSKIVLGGDFIYDCNNMVELNNLESFYVNNNVEFVIGNHDNCNSIFKLSRNPINFHYELVNESLLFYLNTSKENNLEIDQYMNFIDEVIINQNPKSIIIFTHQLIFSETDWFVRVNSRKFYDFGTNLYRRLYNKYNNQQIPFYFIAGDIGAFDYTPYAFYHKENNFNLLASGLGNNQHSIGIKIDIGPDINIDFINLKSEELYDIDKFSKMAVQLYQFPKLFLSFLKSNSKLFFSILLTIILVYLLFINYKKYV